MTTDKIMARADNLDALRTAVESLVADRDALQSIVEASTRDAPGWYHRAVEYMQSHAALAQPEPAAPTPELPEPALHANGPFGLTVIPYYSADQMREAEARVKGRK